MSTNWILLYLDGWVEALILLLKKRFGALPRPLRQRIHQADLATVERWFVRAIDAPDLRSVFEASP